MPSGFVDVFRISDSCFLVSVKAISLRNMQKSCRFCFFRSRKHEKMYSRHLQRLFVLCFGAWPSHCLWVTEKYGAETDGSKFVIYFDSQIIDVKPPSTQICPNDIVIFRSVYLYPGRGIRLEFNITRMFRVAPNPETQSLPADLNPSRAATTLIW
jgi:hypothetical protein